MELNRQEDALHFAELVRTKQVSPKELAESAIRKIEEQNPQLNAVTHTRFEKALLEAETRDFSNLPFSGVPILLKGLGQNLAGEPNTSGAKLFRNAVSPKTSHYTQALLDAGFLILGQTNTPEFGFKNITEPELYGPARNPWNQKHTPGGSSGGAAAAVASGMVPAAGAGDGGGSIRIPASFTGLVGLKPTRGRTPVGPGTGRGWQGASIDFALTKSIRDTAAILDILQTVQPAAAFQVPLFSKGYSQHLANYKRKKFRIAYSLQSPVHSAVSKEAKQAVLQMARWLEQEGHLVEEKEPAIDGVELMKSYYLMNCGETAAMLENAEKYLGRGLSFSDVEPVTWVLYQAGKKVSAAAYSKSIQKWDAAAEIMADFHTAYDFFLTPATAEAAPKVGIHWQTEQLLKKMERAQDLTAAEQQQLVWDMFGKSLPITPFGMQANLTGAPSLSLPTFLTEEGLPLGVQFTALKGREDLLLEIGQEIEAAGLFL